MFCFIGVENRQRSLRSLLRAASGSPSLSRFLRFAKKRQLLTQLSSLQNRQRPTFPGSLPPSIISARELNFCVRDGYRCVLPAIVTGFPICSSIFLASQIVLIYLNVLSSVPSKLNNDYALLVLLKPLVKRSTD